MKEKRKGNIPVKRKPKDDGFFLITHGQVTLRFD
jgi:hypothetical protein